MAIVKRHIVYMSDAEWDELRQDAAASGHTISDIIRNRLRPRLSPLLITGPQSPEPNVIHEKIPTNDVGDFLAATKAAQKRRDAVLRGVNRK